MFKKIAILASLSLMLAAGIVMTNHSSAEAGYRISQFGNSIIYNYDNGGRVVCQKFGSTYFCN